MRDPHDAAHDHKRVDVRKPLGVRLRPQQADQIFRHRCIQLPLNHPEPGDDQDERHESAITKHTNKCPPDFGERSADATYLWVSIGNRHHDQGSECHARRIIINSHQPQFDMAQPFAVESDTKRICKRLSEERPDVHHEIEDRERAGPMRGIRTLRGGPENDGFDDGAADGNESQRRNGRPFDLNGPEQRIAGRQKGERYDQRRPKSDSIRKRSHERWKQVEEEREHGGHIVGPDIAITNLVGKVSVQCDEHAIERRSFKQLRDVGKPERRRELPIQFGWR